MDADRYAYWHALLARIPGGQIPQEPQAGFWRRRMGKGGPWRPVAMWWDGDVLRCLDGTTEVEPWRVWDWCCVNATTEADYRAKMRGRPYRDEFSVAGSASDDHTTDVTKASAIGPKRRHHGDQQAQANTPGGGDERRRRIGPGGRGGKAIRTPS